MLKLHNCLFDTNLVLLVGDDGDAGSAAGADRV